MLKTMMMMMMMMRMMNCFGRWFTDVRRLAISPAGTILRDPHQRESLTRREQDLTMVRPRVQALFDGVVQ